MSVLRQWFSCDKLWQAKSKVKQPRKGIVAKENLQAELAKKLPVAACMPAGIQT